MCHLHKELATSVIAAGIFLMVAATAFSQNYPTRPVRIIVPTSPGAHSDVTARSLSPELTKRLRQRVVVENRPGGGTMIGGDMVAKSPPDGHTLLMGGPSLSINPSIYKKVPYDALRDFAPITMAIKQPLVLLVHPSLPVKSVKDLIALAKARPGDIEYGSPGKGSGPHLSMELFLYMSGARMLHIPYKGPAMAIIDLRAGRVSAMMLSMTGGMPHVRAGRLHALALSGTKRNAAMPSLPTISEAGLPGYESAQWNGLLAPTGTPSEIVKRLHKEVVAALLLPDLKESANKMGADVVASTPGEFAAHLRAETAKWAKVAKSAGIRPE